MFAIAEVPCSQPEQWVGLWEERGVPTMSIGLTAPEEAFLVSECSSAYENCCGCVRCGFGPTISGTRATVHRFSDQGLPIGSGKASVSACRVGSPVPQPLINLSGQRMVFIALLCLRTLKRWLVSYAIEVVGSALTLFLNVFGNSSLKLGIRVEQLRLPDGLLVHWPGLHHILFG